MGWGDIVEIGTLGIVDGGDLDGSNAASAAQGAASTQAAAQREALEYLRQQNRVPSRLRDNALNRLASIQGVNTNDGGFHREMFIKGLKRDPLYESIMSTMDSSEDAILRNASATGGLRSGDSNDALAENAQQLEQKALLTAYQDRMSGLQGLAGLSTNENNIAKTISGIGRTQAQGQVAAANAEAQGTQNLFNMGLNAAAIAFSDRRLKTNIRRIGEMDGLPVYEWDWNDIAQSMGLEGSAKGFMADEVEKVYPDRVSMKNGYKTVRGMPDVA